MRGARLVAVTLLATAPLAAQATRTDPVDRQLWAGAALDVKLPGPWEAGVQYRARFVDDASDYRGSTVSLEGRHTVASRLQLLGGYRLALFDGRTYHRVAVGAEGKRDLGDATIALRGLLQSQRRTFAEDEERSGDAKTLARLRLRGTLPLSKRIDVYASTEPAFAFGADYPVDNWRHTVGLKAEFAKGRTLDLFYIYRPDYAKSYNRTFHIIGAELEIDTRLRRRTKEPAP